MGDRSYILFREGMGGSWRAYYHHWEGQPSMMGVYLITLIKKGLAREEIVQELNRLKLKTIPEGFIDYPEQAFEIQTDLYWIYVVQFSGKASSVSILRTSAPKLRYNFVFRIFSRYFQYIPSETEEIKSLMENAEYTSSVILNAFAAYTDAMEGTYRKEVW